MTDLSGVVNEQQATIETLRRRVAELEGERATPRQFFSYDPDDGFEEFDTADEAKAHAETSLDLWRDSAGDGWSDESMRVCWGIICQSIRIVNQQEYDPEKHVFVSPDCAWVEERILCSEDASKEISRLEAENAELKRQVEALREDAEVGRLVKALLNTKGFLELKQFDKSVRCIFALYPAINAADVLDALKEAHDMHTKEGGVE